MCRSIVFFAAIFAAWLGAESGRAHSDESNIGYIFPLMGAVSIIMCASVLGKLVSRFGEVKREVG